MPILADEKTLDSWLTVRVKRGVPELGRDSRLGRAIAGLQPFAGEVTVLSILTAQTSIGRQRATQT